MIAWYLDGRIVAGIGVHIGFLRGNSQQLNVRGKVNGLSSLLMQTKKERQQCRSEVHYALRDHVKFREGKLRGTVGIKPKHRLGAYSGAFPNYVILPLTKTVNEVGKRAGPTSRINSANVSGDF